MVSFRKLNTPKMAMSTTKPRLRVAVTLALIRSCGGYSQSTNEAVLQPYEGKHPFAAPASPAIPPPALLLNESLRHPNASFLTASANVSVQQQERFVANATPRTPASPQSAPLLEPPPRSSSPSLPPTPSPPPPPTPTPTPSPAPLPPPPPIGLTGKVSLLLFPHPDAVASGTVPNDAASVGMRVVFIFLLVNLVCGMYLCCFADFEMSAAAWRQKAQQI